MRRSGRTPTSKFLRIVINTRKLATQRSFSIHGGSCFGTKLSNTWSGAGVASRAPAPVCWANSCINEPHLHHPMITRQQRDHKAGPIIASSRRACMLKSRSLSLCFLRTKGAEFQSRRPCRNKRRGITNDQAIGTESFPNLHSAYIIWLDRVRPSQFTYQIWIS